MWSPNNLKRNQSDSDNERRQHVFMEKRQRALRKRRKKSSTVKSEQYNLGNIHAGRLVSLPGLSKTRLSRKLGNLSNGVQGTIPAIRKIQQQLDMDLAHRNIDLDNIKGPPIYRNLPKPTLLESKPGSINRCTRTADSRDLDHVRQSYAMAVGGDGMAVGSDVLMTPDDDVMTAGVSHEVADAHERFNMMLAKKISEAWPNLTYELELQTTLDRQMEHLKVRARNTPPTAAPTAAPEVEPGSGSSSTNLSKPFSSCFINGDCNGTKDFNQSFCRTIKRTFYRGNKENPAIEEDPFCDEDLKPSERFTMCDSGLDVSASALSLFETKYDTEDSGRGSSSTDFLDTITDTYHGYEPYLNIPNSQISSDNNPELVVRGIRKDFVDVVDSMYSTSFSNEQYLFEQPFPNQVTKCQPLTDRYPSHFTKSQPITDRYPSHLTKSQPITRQNLKHVSKVSKPSSEPYYYPDKENREPNNLKPSSEKRERSIFKSSSGKSKQLRNKKFYINKEWLN